jgi:hypothetical protein
LPFYQGTIIEYCALLLMIQRQILLEHAESDGLDGTIYASRFVELVLVGIVGSREGGVSVRGIVELS